ncbi:MAG: hypothetical protein K2H30_02665, partial [Clostridia bacterium]|nr:hypothetical protein [Clostridia bacterium]
MNTKKKSIFVVMLTVLFAILIGCAFILPEQKAKAYAPSSSTAIDLTLADYEKRTDGKAINPLGLSKLFDVLTGVQNSKLSDVTALGDMDASQLNSNGLVVNFGGRQWNGVYFTHNTDGDPILTLWLADNSEVQANYGYNAGTAASSAVPTCSYPSDMYSTSQIRVETLNAGGDAGGLTYATGFEDCSGTVITDRKQNPFAAFTLSSNVIGNKSLTKYIEVPNNIAYQQDENFVDVCNAQLVRWVLANDALSIPKATTQYNNARWATKSGITYNYSGVATGSASDDAVNPYVDSSRYTEWGGDYLWLPSITETGYYDSATVYSYGLWNITQDQRQTSGGETWTRSGWPGDCRYAVQLNANGSFEDRAGGRRTHTSLYVRPALHLNLSEMEDGAITNPADVTTERVDNSTKTIAYDGTVKSLDKVLPEWYLNCEDFFNEFADITYNYKNTGDTTAFDSSNPGIVTAATNVINAGRYEITITLKSNSPFTWFDSSGAAVTKKKVILTIQQKEVKFDYRLFDTSGGGSTILAGTSVDYTSDATKTYAVKPYSSTETIPSGTTSLFPDWKMEYEGTANDGTVYAKSTIVPTLAGSYKATLTDLNAATSNYLLKGSTTVYNYTVDKAEVNLPSFSDDKTYNASAQDFTLSDYDTDILKIAGISVGAVTLTANGTGTQYKSADNYFVVDYDATDKKLSAMNSAEYTVTFDLVDTNNYTWSSAVATGAKTKTFTIDKKELVIKFLSPLSNNQNFNLKTNTKGNLTAEYTDGAETPDGGSIEEPQLILSYVFTNGTITGGKTQAGSTCRIEDFSLDISTLKGDGNVFSVGTYTLTFELAPDTAAAVNKNYKLGTSATQALTVTAGEASIDDIEIVYNTVRGENDGDANAAIPAAGLTYVYDKTYGATEYKIYLDFSGIDYLDYANGTSSLTYDYADGTHTINKAGTVTVTAVIKPKDTNHSLPATYDVTATNKFKSYTNNNDGTATVTFEIVINKAVATVAGSEIPLMYQREGSTDVVTYDPKKPPVYNGKPVTITLGSSALFPDTVKSVVFDDAVIRQTTAGDYTIRATVTLSDNYVTATGASTMIVNIPWSIAKEQIDLVWSNIVYADDYFNDSSLAHLQITLLTLTDVQKDNVDYEFYKEEADGTISSVPMTEAQIKALCTNERFTETTPTYIYVKAVLTTDGAKKYQLEDDETKNPKRLRLGGNMTQINLTVSDLINDFEYGSELDVTKLFTLKNNETNDVWDSDYYDITVRKDGELLCSLADFKPSEADAGEYTFVIDIKPEYADSYVLDRSNKVSFVINAKEVELPTLSEIIFSGEYINVEDYLGGSWEQIKSLVTLSGDYKDKRNVSAGGYIMLLELDGNYRWAYPDAASAVKALLGRSAADVEITAVSDNIASMKWNITPIVLDTTSLWNKSANGATLNLPDAVNKLVNAETLSVGYKYYDDAGQYIAEPELKGGKSFRVEAIFGGIDADMSNVVFLTGDGNFSATSERISYTVPQSGAAAALGAVKDFMTKTFLGLPYWVWALIALAVIILLIIIIVVACKRRKSKEERAEAKARKEEEKARREEERQLQREKLEAERELAKAKQEAELEKIRMQAGMGMAGVGMASMAMQQPVQQSIPQQMPQQQQMPQYIPMPMPQYPPQAAAQPSLNMAEVNAIAEAKAAQAIAEAKAAQAEARAAEAIAEAKAAQAVAGISPWHGGQNYGYTNQPQPFMQMQNQQQQPIVIVVDSDGQVKSVQSINQPQQPMIQPILIAANADSAKFTQKPAEIPHTTEESNSSS